MHPLNGEPEVSETSDELRAYVRHVQIDMHEMLNFSVLACTFFLPAHDSPCRVAVQLQEVSAVYHCQSPQDL